MQEDEEEYCRISVLLDPVTKYKARVRASMEGRTISDVVRELLENYAEAPIKKEKKK